MHQTPSKESKIRSSFDRLKQIADPIGVRLLVAAAANHAGVKLVAWNHQELRDTLPEPFDFFDHYNNVPQSIGAATVGAGTIYIATLGYSHFNGR